MKRLTVLPMDFQLNWMASLQPAQGESAYRLVDIQRTPGMSGKGAKVNVQVLDINGFPMAGKPVAFAFDTGPQFFLTDDFTWVPPTPHQAIVSSTTGGGETDAPQGRENVVGKGRPGGMTVYVLDPAMPSDVVSGMGMLADHTGVQLVFQQQPAGAKSMVDQLADLQARVAILEERIR